VFTGTSTAVLKLATIAMSLAMMLRIGTASAEPEPPASPTGAIPVYAAPDESALLVATLASDEKTTPIAETQGGDGIKWYLIKTNAGIVGWLRHKNNAAAKNAESFFRARPRERPVIALETRSASPSASSRGAVIIPVTLRGRSVIVPVTLNRSISANLLLDTGASMTMISRTLANTLALPATGAGLFSGIGGTVSAPIARLESIKVGDAEVSGMAVSIHDTARFPHFEGLLGMDFLGRFEISVDSAKQLLVLTPK
jgi:hypothetical protein